jgi:hypothetical protein
MCAMPPVDQKLSHAAGGCRQPKIRNGLADGHSRRTAPMLHSLHADAIKIRAGVGRGGVRIT